ncbi:MULTISPECIES: HAD family hydrolase [Vibrio]|uniref:HAD family hydrolase n=1 Tax=Vibrio TaxID=662 RepID=UPI002074DE47|nr:MULTISPECIES: HAD family hydrolase [Vibrio]USD34456.1 HAD family hydrolase [Vibrio sp. SCSIO 43186]USD47527.1 HAD family hydrolase [Vibrio sp. SCSIO 43145]USD71581.1 HAD family hydrolase [Vibrio sp. SCSIO 43139]USD98485.1 phosphatase [Vibrio coralliilyticus]
MDVIPLDIAKIKAIVFDLDNTLVSSNLDFQWLRAQVGCPRDVDLLTFIDKLDCSHSALRAKQLVLQHELDDAEQSTPMPGCLALLDFIAFNHLHTAIITRNCQQASQRKVDHNQLNISRIISREHFPPKPAPDSLLALAREWQLPPEQILYVGDYMYDLQAASNARMPSCLVTHGKPTTFNQHASLSVDHLNDLLDLFSDKYPQTVETISSATKK